MKLMRYFHNKSLRAKLIVSSILCLVIPTVITLLFADLTTRKVLNEEAIRNEIETLGVIEQYIENRLNKMIYISNFIQFDDEIHSIINKRWNQIRLSQEPDSYELFVDRKKITNKLNNISFPDEETHITILLPDGTNYSNYAYLELEPDSLLETSWFQSIDETSTHTLHWLQTHEAYLKNEAEKGDSYITLVKTMRSFSSKPYGYIVISINESQIHQIFSKESKTSEKMLLHQNGLILSHTDANYIGQPYEHMPDLTPNTQVVDQFIHIDGQQFLIVLSKLGITNWYVLSKTSYDTALGKVHQILRTNMVLQIIFFFVFLIILIYLVRQFTKPIVTLGRVALEVDAGNLQVRSHIRGANEVGRLGRSFDKMLDRIQLMIDQITIEQTSKRKAELKMLQAQINPHFLFNILNSIRMNIMLRGDTESAALIRSLASLLRMTISKSNELITLREEIETVIHYMKLMNFRQKETLQWEIDLSPEASFYEVPRFFLQPFIENAIIHGFQNGQGLISIQATYVDYTLMIKIQDNGLGMDEATLQSILESLHMPTDDKRVDHSSFSGIGVKNVYERMKLIYGERFSFDLRSEPNQGTTIYLSITEEPLI